MKIGVYGDSFAGINTRFQPNSFSPEDAGAGWVELLEDDGNHKITNFSKPGTAFLYTYEKFLEHHKNFDLNIVVVTSPDRTYIKALGDILVFGEEWLNHEIKRLEKIWYPEKNKHLRILESVRVYLNEWVDWDMRTHIQHVLVNNLWNLSSNTIVIPAFLNSIEQTKKNLNDCAYLELSLVDPEEFKQSPLGRTTGDETVVCRRKCHFSAENNQHLYRLVKNAIETEKKIVEFDIKDVITPSKHYYHYVKWLKVK